MSRMADVTIITINHVCSERRIYQSPWKNAGLEQGEIMVSHHNWTKDKSKNGSKEKQVGWKEEQKRLDLIHEIQHSKAIIGKGWLLTKLEKGPASLAPNKL